jgi:phosphatidylglycerol:prolipoprotein diacylglycerol transferase
MIDPIITSFDIGGLTITLRWYGLILMTAVVVGAWLADREFQRRGGQEEFIWNALIWVLPAALVGARLWYVLNTTAGGNLYYVNDPSRIFAIAEGGLHIFGAILLGGGVALYYARRTRVDTLMILDSIAPSLLLAQALARPANFINQELYGQPTDLPWGIPIAAENRIGPWADLAAYPEDATRFHPTFAYEMVWNIVTGGLLLWLTPGSGA